VQEHQAVGIVLVGLDLTEEIDAAQLSSRNVLGESLELANTRAGEETNHEVDQDQDEEAQADQFLDGPGLHDAYLSLSVFGKKS
jgi:hypothetical protein